MRSDEEELSLKKINLFGCRLQGVNAIEEVQHFHYNNPGWMSVNCINRLFATLVMQFLLDLFLAQPTCVIRPCGGVKNLDTGEEDPSPGLRMTFPSAALRMT